MTTGRPDPDSMPQPRRLMLIKLAVTLVALGAAAGYAALEWRGGKVAPFDGGFALRTGPYMWQFRMTGRMLFEVVGGVLGFVLLAGLWPRVLSPRSPLAQAAAFAGLLWLALGLLDLQVSWATGLDPFDAALCAAIALGASYYLALRPRGGRPWLARLGDRFAAGGSRWWAAPILVATLALLVFGCWWFYMGGPLITDAQSQISQARLMWGGHFTYDLSPELRQVLSIPYAVRLPRAYSQFPPGHTLLLIPFVATGVPVQALNIAEGLALALVVWVMARRLEGPAVGWIALLLLVASPFFLAIHAGAMNHATSALALWIAAWAFLPGGGERRAARTLRRDLAIALVGGFALGWGVMTRPLTGLIHGILWAGVWLALFATALRHGRADGATPGRLAVRLGAAVAGMLPPAAIFMFYNAMTTGHPLVMGYEVSNPVLHRLGFFASEPGGLSYLPRDAVDNFAADFLASNFFMFGSAIGSWTLIAAWWWRTRLPRPQIVLIAMIALQVGVYRLYQFHDLLLGPRFLYDLLPAVVLLAAAAFGPLARAGGMRAGATLLVVLTLAAGSLAYGCHWLHLRYASPAAHNHMVDDFMRKLLPIHEPTVVTIPRPYDEMIGRWFPSAPGEPPIWFIHAERVEAARRVPELQNCRWVAFDPESPENAPIPLESEPKP